jgi:hypothetical protein
LIQNGEMKVLFNKFHRWKNLAALLFNNSGSRNKTTYSEYRNLKSLRVFSYKVWGLKVPYVWFAICGKYSRARLAHQIFFLVFTDKTFHKMQILCISNLVFSRKLHTKRAYHPIFNRFLFFFSSFFFNQNAFFSLYIKLNSAIWQRQFSRKQFPINEKTNSKRKTLSLKASSLYYRFWFWFFSENKCLNLVNCFHTLKIVLSCSSTPNFFANFCQIYP